MIMLILLSAVFVRSNYDRQMSSSLFVPVADGAIRFEAARCRRARMSWIAVRQRLPHNVLQRRATAGNVEP